MTIKGTAAKSSRTQYGTMPIVAIGSGILFYHCLNFESVLVPTGCFAYLLKNAITRKFFHAVYENSIQPNA